MNDFNKLKHIFILVGFLLIFLLTFDKAEAQIMRIDNCSAVINQPGEYRLTRDLSCVGNGLTITANGVHLDLQHRSLIGDGTGVGITVTGTNRDVHLNNGKAIGFAVGVRYVNVSDAHSQLIEVRQNKNAGIVLENVTNSTFHSNITAENFGNGFELINSSNNQFSGNATFSNSGHGFQMMNSTRNQLFSYTVGGNGADGMRLINSHQNLISASGLKGNTDDGIKLLNSRENNIQSISAFENGDAGIEVGVDSVGNIFQSNSALKNSILDLRDLNLPNCANHWSRNNFRTDNEGNGKDTGCIQ